jgi:hypothetical protein
MTDAKFFSEEKFLVSIDPTTFNSKKRKPSEDTAAATKLTKSVNPSKESSSKKQSSERKPKSHSKKQKENSDSSSDRDIEIDASNSSESEVDSPVSKRDQEHFENLKVFAILIE